MSTLLLVRHGQARPFEADSDRLSDLGAEQARQVGEYLAKGGVDLDAVYSGTLQRHRQTCALAREAFQALGRRFPDPVEQDCWNEYDASGIVGRLLPALASRREDFRELVAAFQAGLGGSDRNRHFQRMFEVLMEAWERGEVEDPDVESFESFHARVTSGLSAITETGDKGRVAVFTSGGPIGVCMQSVLGAPRSTALRLNYRVRNASLTEFVFGRGRISLEYFNVVHFLPGQLRTFR